MARRWQKVLHIFLSVVLALSMFPVQALAEVVDEVTPSDEQTSAERLLEQFYADKENDLGGGSSEDPEDGSVVDDEPLIVDDGLAGDADEPAVVNDEPAGGVDEPAVASDVPEVESDVPSVINGAPTITSAVPTVSIDDTDLIGGYIEQRFNAELPSTETTQLRARPTNTFTGNDAVAYDLLKRYISDVAAGRYDSAIFEIDIASLGSGRYWTAGELGVASIVDDGDNITEAAVAAVQQKIDVNFDAIVNALLVDCPYELYWFDKETGYSYETPGVSAWTVDGEWVIGFDSDARYIIYMAVSADYSQDGSAGTYYVDTTTGARVSDAVMNAGMIASECESYGYSTYETLEFFKDRICDLTDYDFDAINPETNTRYGDPWQLVNVFDADPDTKVVCEGYSKAFAYLCELAGMGNSCFIVTGNMTGGTGEGGHMWNLVKMDDGRVYLVDVTNCDDGSVGYPNELFIAPYDSLDGDAYVFEANGEYISYAYDSEMASLYSAEDLAVSDTAYSAPELPEPTEGWSRVGSCEWQIDGDTLTIRPLPGYETGTLPNTNNSPLPGVSDENVKNVVIAPEVKSGSSLWGAFYNCSNLESIDLSGLDTSAATDMSFMFNGCSVTTLDLSGFDTSNVAYMDAMFQSCFYLESVDLSSFNTTSVVEMGFMFNGCNVLQSLNLSSFNTSNVQNMSHMFCACSSLTSLDLSGFDTSAVQQISGMFWGCSSLESLDLSRFDTSEVVDASNMFLNLDSLQSFTVGETFVQPIEDDCWSAPDGIWIASDNTYWSGYELAHRGEADTYTAMQPSEGWTKLGSCEWQIDGDTLTIRPLHGGDSGRLPDNIYSTLPGVDDENVRHVVFAPGVKAGASLSYSFCDCDNLESIDFTGLDTSDTTNMSCMFSSSELLESLNVSGFDTSKVTSMYGMFDGCNNLSELDVTQFNTSAVTNMSYMFNNCISLTELNLSNFDTSNVESMCGMFQCCYSLAELDVTNFVTSSVTDMSGMFNGCSNLSELDFTHFDTSCVEYMYRMFGDCRSLVSLNLASFDTSHVQDMAEMFSGLKSLQSFTVGASFVQPDESWSAPEGLWVSTTDNNTYSGYNLAHRNVADTYTALQPSAGWTALGSCEYQIDGDTLTIRPIQGGESGTLPNTDYCTLPGVNDENVKHVSIAPGVKAGTNLAYAFSGCWNLVSIDLANLDTSDTVVMSHMFSDCYNITALDVSGFETTNVINMGYMFAGCNGLSSLTLFKETSSVADMEGMFASCQSLSQIDLSDWNTTSVTRMYAMFNDCPQLSSLDISSFNTANVTDMGYMFNGMDALQSFTVGDGFVQPTEPELWSVPDGVWIGGDGNSYSGYELAHRGVADTYTAMQPSEGWTALGGCEYQIDGDTLTIRPLRDQDSGTLPDTDYGWLPDASNWNVRHVVFAPGVKSGRSLAYAFYGCPNLESIDFSGLDTSAATNMYSMFHDCSDLKELDLSGFNTSAVTNMTFMFRNCWNLSNLNISNFNTSSVQYMNSMFSDCVSLTFLDLSHFNTSAVTEMTDMFAGCDELVFVNVSNFVTTNVVSMRGMFYCCSVLSSLDLSSFDTSSAQDMGDMFYGLNALQTFTVGDNFVQPEEDGFWSVPSGSWIGTDGRAYSGYELAHRDVADTYVLPADISAGGIAPIEDQVYTGFAIMPDVVVTFFGETLEENTDYTVEYSHNISTGTATVTVIGIDLYAGCLTTTFDILPPDGLVAAGISGTCSWTVGEDGLLRIFPTNGESGALEHNYEIAYFGDAFDWYLYRDAITSVVVEEGVSATSLRCMLFDCSNLTAVDLSGLDTTALESTSYMFSGCVSLTELDLSEFDVSSVTNMSAMFNLCSGLETLNLSNWNTASVVYMSYLFNGCPSLISLDLSSFDTRAVENAGYMFSGCSALETLIVGDNFVQPESESTWIRLWSAPSGVWVAESNGRYYSGNELAHRSVADTYTKDPTLLTMGTCGTCTWTLDTDGLMRVFPTDGVSGVLEPDEYGGYWHTNGDDYYYSPSGYVVSVVVDEGVSATSLNNMFSYFGQLEYADLKNLDTSAVTDMSYLFYDCTRLTSVDLTGWDTSHVTNMSGMFNGDPFGGSRLTTVDMTGWDTSSVTDMSFMFRYCRSLMSLDASKLDTSSVTNMRQMFYSCTSLTSLDLSSWDTSKVQDMSGMFTVDSWLDEQNTSLVSIDLRGWDTKSVTDMSNMFALCSNLEDLDVSGLDTSSVTTMNRMFMGCKNVTLDVSDWDVSSVQDMSYMFNGCGAPVLDVSKWVTSSATSMEGMFSWCENLASLDLSGFDTSSVPSTYYMFEGASALDTIKVGANFVQPEAEGYWSAPEGVWEAESDGSLSWAYGFAHRVGAETYHRSALDGYKAYGSSGTCYWTIDNDGELRIYPIDGESGVLAHNYDIAYYGEGFDWYLNREDITSVVVEDGVAATDLRAMLFDCPNLESVDLSGLDTSQLASTVYMFSGCSSLTELDLSEFNTENVTNMAGMFNACTSLETLNLTGLNTAQVYSTNCMFNGCSSLPSLDLTGFDTAAVTDPRYMFAGCSALETLKLGASFVLSENEAAQAAPEGVWVAASDTGTYLSGSDLMTRGVAETYTRDMSLVEAGTWGTCSWSIDTDGLLRIYPTDGVSGILDEPDLIGFPWSGDRRVVRAVVDEGVSAGTSLDNLFYCNHDLVEADLHNLNTSNVTSMGSTFYYCTSLESVDVSGWDTSRVTNMNFMFAYDRALETLDLSGFATSSVTDMSCMFEGSEGLVSLNLAGWDTSRVTDMRSMFWSCRNLASLNLTGWRTPSVTDMSGMFAYCESLKAADVSGWDTSQVTDMSYMFADCSSLILLDLSDWNTSLVSNMSRMLDGCSALATLKLGSDFVEPTDDGLWSVPQGVWTASDGSTYWGSELAFRGVADTYTRVEGIAAIGTAGTCTWTIDSDGLLTVYPTDGVSGVLEAEYTFEHSDYFGWYQYHELITGAVIEAGVSATSLKYMFYGCKNMTSVDLDGLDTTNVTNMNAMFYECASLTELELPDFDTSHVTNMAAMFNGCTSLTNLDLSGIETSAVTNMHGMFWSCYKLASLNLSGFDTADVTNMAYMFSGCSSLTTLNLGSFNTSNVTDMGYMFDGCSSLKTVYVGEGWTTSALWSSKNMFVDCAQLMGGNGTAFNPMYVASTYARIDAVDVPGYFTDVAVLDSPSIATATISAIEDQVYTGSEITPAFTVTVDGDVLTEGTDYTATFKDNIFDGTATITILGAGDYAGTGVATATFQILPPEGYLHVGMWGTCLWDIDVNGKLTVHPGEGGSYFIYEYEDQMTSYMNYCSYWFPYNDLITSAVFAEEGGQKVVAQEASIFMLNMLSNLVSVDLSGLDTTNLTEMTSMFYKCSSLKSVNLTGLNTSNVFSTANMFEDCTSLETVDLSGFDTSALLYTNAMFYNCGSLTTIIADDAWSMDNVAQSQNMFYGCASLVGGNGTAFDEANVDGTYAHIDVAGNPGYFSTLGEATDISSAAVSAIEDRTYTGSPIEPEFMVTLSGNRLEKGRDYTVEFTDNTNVGTATFTVTGTGNYNGSLSGSFEIVAADIEQAEVTADDQVYTGSELKPAVTVALNGKTLVSGTDYTVEYGDNVNVGTVTFTVTGEGNYTGSVAGSFKITAASIEQAEVTANDQTYTGSALTPVTVKLNGKTLVSGTDYTVEYGDNVNVGTVTFTVTGEGNYTGSVAGSFKILAASISGAAVKASDQVYTGSALEPTATVTLDGKTLVKGTDYTVAYSNNTAVGTATITVTGINNYSGSSTGSFRITAKSISGATVSVPNQTYTFTGSELKPAVTVTLTDGTVLTSGTDYSVVYGNNVNAGTATITVTGKGSYGGTATGSFKITAKNIEGATVSAADQTYTGTALTPVTVKLDGKTLVSGTDYSVTYSNNTNAGTATYKVTPKGNYTGSSIDGSFKISAKSIESASVTAAGQTYTGSALTTTVTVKDGSKTLASGTDYTVSYSNNTNAGTATVTVTGKGNYAKSKSVNFTISAKSISGAAVSASSQTFTGSALKPTVTVTLNGKTLSSSDFTVAYGNNTNVGTASITVTGKGNYTGTATGSFAISAKSISGASVTAAGQTYTGSALKPAATVSVNGKTLVSGTDYTVAYSNNTVVGTATITVTAKGNYTGTASGTFKISAASISGASVSAEAGQTYTGHALKPAVTVTLNGKTLVSGTDYTVAYSNNTEVGTATITVTAKGNYTGTATGTFKIAGPTYPIGWYQNTSTGAWYYYDNYGVAYTSKWLSYDGKYYYFGADSKLVMNDWVTYSGKRYYMNSSGNPVVNGWVKYNDKYYYMNGSGNPVTSNWVNTGGKYYYFNASGVMVANDWVTYNGKRYYMNSGGNPVTNGWVKSNNKWYYMNGSGNPVTSSWVNTGGKYYYFNSDGTLRMNAWLSYNGKWYYLNGSGNPVTNGWVNDNGTYYYMNGSGNPVTSDWVKSGGKYYYMSSSGAMVTNDWVKYNGSWYYMNGSGNPVTNTWIEYKGTKYHFNSSGVCDKSQAA